jgi:hypothetical protein
MLERMPQPDWTPLLREGTAGVTGRVLLNRGGLVLAHPRFAPGATIDEHAAHIEIDVVCGPDGDPHDRTHRIPAVTGRDERIPRSAPLRCLKTA